MNKVIEIALSQYGIKEIVGESDNPEVMKYFHELGETWVKSDETAWCSAFVNWVCYKASLHRSGKLNARSWMNVGHSIREPELGDIVVLWREDPNSWKGHVGFFIREDDNYVWILGGNQNNMVKISAYNKDRLLDYRRVS